MSGPPPKDPALRQRRNKTSTAADLETEEPAVQMPDLGEHPVDGGSWHPRTRAWWKEVWASPMAKEFLRADTDGLLELAALVDQFWKEPSSKLAAEIRLQRQCFGLTPLDRRRLQWEIKRVEEADKPKTPRRQVPTGDPRAALKAI